MSNAFARPTLSVRRVVRTASASAAAIAVALATGASAQQALKPKLDGPALIRELQKGGLVLLMRHVATDDEVPDPGSHRDAVCETQRNLTDEGRSQAEAIGRAIESLHIPVGAVLSSPYCRCVETGVLVFGAVLQEEKLAVFDQLSGADKDARARELRKLVNTPPEAGKNRVLIAHTGTLLYTFGLQTRPEGIVHVFRPAEFGQAVYLGMVLPDEWSAAAAASPDA